MKTVFKCLSLLAIVNFLSSCGNNRFDIDTSKVSVEPVVFKRLDKDVFSLNASNISNQTVELQKQYSTFYNRFITSIINNGGVQDSLYSESLLKFINDKDMSAAYADVKKVFSDNDVELLGDEMTEVMKRYKVLFPNRKMPKQFVTFMSGFNYNVVYVDSTLGVGLEMYMGSNNPFYSALQFPKYKSRAMNKEHLLADVVRGWLITEFDNSESVNNLLNHMIFYGKVFYTTDVLLPNVADSIKIAYTSQQMIYLDKYEKNLWGFFAKDNKLYENELKLIAEFTNDGPNSAGSISKDCPPRIAMWLGWQIVKSYMEHNENVTFEELIKEKDVQKILSKSKYKP